MKCNHTPRSYVVKTDSDIFTGNHKHLTAISSQKSILHEHSMDVICLSKWRNESIVLLNPRTKLWCVRDKMRKNREKVKTFNLKCLVLRKFGNVLAFFLSKMDVM